MAITAKFEADFSQFKAAVESADGSLKSLEGSAKTLGPAILASLASGEVRRFATEVKNVATEFISAFAEEEAAVKKLDVALQAQGTGAALAQYKALAAQFQNTTVFSDDLVMSMTALMVQVGGVMPGQMQAALTAATNLSAGLGISLETATMLVAKAFGQGGEQLGKLKALLGDTVPKGADMAQVMDAINSKFGGQAAAQLDTYTGKMAQLNNKMSDFKEQVGGLLVEALTPLLNTFAAMPDSMQVATIGIVAIGAALAPLAITVAALTPIVTALSTAIGGAAGLGAAFAGIVKFLGPTGIIAAGIVSWFVVFKNLDVFIWAAVKAWDVLKGAFASAGAAIASSARVVREALGGGGATAPATAGAPAGPVTVPSFAAGGIGNFGSGTLALLHGREAIIPLDGGGGTGGVTINVNMDGMLVSSNPAAREELRRYVSDMVAEGFKRSRKVSAA